MEMDREVVVNESYEDAGKDTADAPDVRESVATAMTMRESQNSWQSLPSVGATAEEDSLAISSVDASTDDVKSFSFSPDEKDKPQPDSVTKASPTLSMRDRFKRATAAKSPGDVPTSTPVPALDPAPAAAPAPASSPGMSMRERFKKAAGMVTSDSPAPAPAPVPPEPAPLPAPAAAKGTSVRDRFKQAAARKQKH